MDKSLAYVLVTMVCAFLQISLAPAITLGDACPDFMLIPVMLIAMRSGYVPGCIAGFFCGLYVDLSGSATVGCMALTFTLVALCAGVLASGLETHSLFVICIFALVSSFLTEFLYGLVISLSNVESSGVMSVMITAALPSGAYTAVFACLFLVLMNFVIVDEQRAFSMNGRSSLHLPSKSNFKLR